MWSLLEALIGGLMIEAAVLGIIVLLFRARGKRLPEWLPIPAALRRWIDRLIDPDPRRLDRLLARARR